MFFIGTARMGLFSLSAPADDTTLDRTSNHANQEESISAEPVINLPAATPIVSPIEEES